MTAGRLTILFLLLPCTMRADRFSDCSEQTTMRIVGCGGSEVKDIIVLYDDKQCEKPGHIVYTELTNDPLTSTRWRIEQATIIMDPVLEAGKFDGDFTGPFEKNHEREVSVRIREADGTSRFIELEKMETRSDGKFSFSSYELPISDNALRSLERSEFVLYMNNNTNKEEVKHSMNAFAKLLRQKQAACNAKLPIGKADDTTSASRGIDIGSTVSPDPSSSGNSSSTPSGSPPSPPTVTSSTLRPTASMFDASAKRSEKAFPLAMVGGAVGALVIIAIFVTIVVVCVKRSKNNRKKVEVPANYVLDRNSKPKETWDQRKEQDRARSKKRKILESLKRRQKQAQTPSTSTPSTNVASFTPSDSDMKQAEDSLGSYANTTVNNTTAAKNSLGSYNE